MATTIARCPKVRVHSLDDNLGPFTPRGDGTRAFHKPRSSELPSTIGLPVFPNLGSRPQPVLFLLELSPPTVIIYWLEYYLQDNQSLRRPDGPDRSSSARKRPPGVLRNFRNGTAVGQPRP